jgi:phosphoribosylglycinamide formyltransferase-1
LSFIKNLSLDIVLILDEAYFEYVEKKDYLDGLTIALERPRTLVLRTFSKVYGLAGIRMGYAIGDKEIISALTALQPDLVVSAGFMRILSAECVSKFKIVNSHPALLPLFPGAHAVRDALAAGATKTGTTIHWVDAGVDTGAIIAQEEVEIKPSDTEESLHERIKIVERRLYVATLQKLLTDVLRFS